MSVRYIRIHSGQARDRGMNRRPTPQRLCHDLNLFKFCPMKFHVQKGCTPRSTSLMTCAKCRATCPISPIKKLGVSAAFPSPHTTCKCRPFMLTNTVPYTGAGSFEENIPWPYKMSEGLSTLLWIHQSSRPLRVQASHSKHELSGNGSGFRS